ncbi:MAG TPA: porin family protein [Cyclobacteriaceae bacterium]|nr:porin family protein [Cyclobacteriaceae bacterium]
MKKILLLLFCLTLSINVFCQWYIGLKAGPTFSNYKSKTPWKEVTNLGFTVGATAYKQVNTHIGYMVDLQYIQKGYYHKICNSISDKLKANYIEVPIIFDYTFIIPSLRNFKAHGNLGLYTAYWLSGKYVDKGIDGTGDTFDFKKNKASRFDVGPNAGGRIEYILKNGSLSLDLRYELGLLDMQKTNDNTNNTNRALIVGLTYYKFLK